MECMYTQTRPRFILSSEKSFRGVELEPMLTPMEISPPPEKKFPHRRNEPTTLHQAGQRAQHTANELFRSQAGTDPHLCWLTAFPFSHQGGPGKWRLLNYTVRTVGPAGIIFTDWGSLSDGLSRHERATNDSKAFGSLPADVCLSVGVSICFSVRPPPPPSPSL